MFVGLADDKFRRLISRKEWDTLNVLEAILIRPAEIPG